MALIMWQSRGHLTKCAVVELSAAISALISSAKRFATDVNADDRAGPGLEPAAAASRASAMATMARATELFDAARACNQVVISRQSGAGHGNHRLAIGRPWGGGRLFEVLVERIVVLLEEVGARVPTVQHLNSSDAHPINSSRVEMVT